MHKGSKPYSADRLGRLGINPDAFGVWEPDAAGNLPWTDFLDSAASAGFELIELGPYGYLPTDAAQLADALAARSLGLSGGYAVGPFHDTGARAGLLDAVRAVAVTTAGAGAGYLMLLASTMRNASGRVALGVEDWRTMVLGLDEARRLVEGEFGLEVVYHPHVGLAVETAEETDRLIQDTAGALAICLDTGQFAYPGGDPADFLDKHGALVRYLHLRDLDVDVRDRCVRQGLDFRSAAQSRVFCEPGDGAINFAGVASAARRAGFDGPVIVERSLLGCTPLEGREAAERACRFYGAAGFGR